MGRMQGDPIRPARDPGTEPDATVQNPRESARRVLGLLRPHLRLVLATVAFGITGNTLNMLSPGLFGHATNLIVAGFVGKQQDPGSTKAEVIERLRADGRDTLANVFATLDLVPGRGIDFDRVAQILALTLLLTVATTVFMFMQGRLAVSVVQRVVLGLRHDVDAKLTRLPMRYFDGQPRGELLSRMTTDIENIQHTLRQVLSTLLTSLFSIPSVLVLMFLTSPALAWTLLLSVPLSAVLVGVVSKRAQPHFATMWASTGRLSAHVEEMYSGQPLVTAFGRHELAERVFDEHNEKVAAAESSAQRISGTIEPLMLFVSSLTYIGVAVIGGLRVAAGSLSIGGVQAFIQYSGRFTLPVSTLAGMAGQLQSGLASAERVFALLDAEEQAPEPVRPVPVEQVRGQVDFERISFRYTPDTPLIDDLSLTVRPGQTVAIVGPTGAGKTTLGNLLMRFYDVTAGRILLDGSDITAMTRADLRTSIGLVSQDAWLFNGTIAENIAYGLPDATREDVVAAARATCVDRFVRTLPAGYDTVLDDECANLSAGERQLLTVARAFMTRPALLVLDEATSSVDSRTEVLIQRATKALLADRTSFIIAHRLSTIRDADVILVMDSGRIAERGSHDELMSAGGTYARMHAAARVPGRNAGSGKLSRAAR
jgi:ATP-binding cassette subfamily B protein